MPQTLDPSLRSGLRLGSVVLRLARADFGMRRAEPAMVRVAALAGARPDVVASVGKCLCKGVIANCSDSAPFGRTAAIMRYWCDIAD